MTGVFFRGALLSIMFIVALYLTWCRYLAAQEGFSLSCMLINLKCVSRDTELLLNAARFTTGYVRLVGQEPAPSKCVLLSTSREVRKGMKEHLDTTIRGSFDHFTTCSHFCSPS